VCFTRSQQKNEMKWSVQMKFISFLFVNEIKKKCHMNPLCIGFDLFCIHVRNKLQMFMWQNPTEVNSAYLFYLTDILNELLWNKKQTNCMPIRSFYNYFTIICDTKIYHNNFLKIAKKTLLHKFHLSLSHTALLPRYSLSYV
jgi:hypothetical protein